MRRLRVLGIVAGLVLVVACAVPDQEAARMPISTDGAPPPLPADCTTTVGDPAATMGALDAASAGDTICLEGDRLRDTDLVVSRSGTADRPITLAGGGAPVRSVTVQADHVVVEGLTVVDGEGIVLAGGGLVARSNEVRNATADGISCEESCVDAQIEGNTVVGTDGTGIIVEGQRIVVRKNNVSGSVRREAGDADGVRFFGTDISIVENVITDIKDDGYVGEPPHTDCFQTFDNSSLPTVDASIVGNICRNVDHQCLIATAEESGMAGIIGRSQRIEFVGNICEVEGSQAVLVQWIPYVTVRDNSFAGPNLDRAAIFLDGSVGAQFFGNRVQPGVTPYELDDSSEEGFRTDQPIE